MNHKIRITVKRVVLFVVICSNAEKFLKSHESQIKCLPFLSLTYKHAYTYMQNAVVKSMQISTEFHISGCPGQPLLPVEQPKIDPWWPVGQPKLMIYFFKFIDVGDQNFMSGNRNSIPDARQATGFQNKCETLI